MVTIPELLDGHVTLEVECLDRLYLNGYIGKLATGPGLFFFMQDQLGKPIPSPVVLGQISEKFREAVKALAEQEGVPVYQFRHKERKARSSWNPKSLYTPPGSRTCTNRWEESRRPC
jgi:hypothetical protein